MKRYEDWPERLDAFLRTRRMRRFVWGEQDCCMFVCDGVRAMTGVDLADGYRVYDSAGQARAFLREGLAKLVEHVTAAHGIAEIAPRFVQRGDIALFEDFHREALGLVNLDSYWVVAPGPSELRLIPTDCILRAWRV